MKTQRTHNIFVKEVKEILGEDYKVLSEFKGRKKEILMKHITCGNEYITKPDGILSRGSGCPKCAHKNQGQIQMKSTETFTSELNELNITLLSKYTGVHKRVNVRCNVCNNIWSSTPNKLLMKRGCRKCADKKRGDQQRFSHKQFLEKLPTLFKQEYSVLEDYKGTHTKIKFKHNICGNEFYKTPNNITSNNQLCPVCFSSNGEKEIYKYLKENNVNFYHNYIHPNMNRNLRMDFYLYNKNIVIEFDGRQHFEVNEYFGGETEFHKTQERDQYKNNFCDDLNIEMVRLKKQDNITNVLDNIFKVQRLSQGDEISHQE